MQKTGVIFFVDFRETDEIIKREKGMVIMYLCAIKYFYLIFGFLKPLLVLRNQICQFWGTDSTKKMKYLFF
jgi:hypothetical protein